MRIVVIVLVSLLCLLIVEPSGAQPGGAPDAAARVAAGRWRGEVALPTGQPLEFFVTFEETPDGEQAAAPAATIDIPVQGLRAHSLSGVEVSNGGVKFAIVQAGAFFEGEWKDDGAIEGVLKQAEVELPFRMARDPQLEAAREPGGAAQWKGVVELPGLRLDFLAVFAQDDAGGGWRGTIDIPLQGVTAAPLQDVAMAEGEIKFTLAPQGSPFPAAFTLNRDGDHAKGELAQGGQVFPTTMERVKEGESAEVGPLRPQTPKAPFAYETREVVVENSAGDVRLAGTLTIPGGSGPHPTVLFLSGSGAQDRDESLLGHKPFAVIADHLTKAGFATLRMDDRGVGGSSGRYQDSTMEDLAGDALAAVAFLRGQPEVDPDRIGILGHSEGGWVAPMAASRSDGVAFLVLMAGPGESGAAVWTGQTSLMLRTSGATAEKVERVRAAQDRVVAALVGGEDGDDLKAVIREMGDAMTDGGQTEVEASAMADGQMSVLGTTWFRSLMGYDPTDALRGTGCPVLAVIGSLDLQVPPKSNMEALERHLRAGGNRDVTIIELEGLNHLLQSATTGLPAEYMAIEETISPRALDVMTTWLRAKAGGKTP